MTFGTVERNEVNNEIKFSIPSVYREEIMEKINRINRKPLRYGLEAIKIIDRKQETRQEEKIVETVFGVEKQQIMTEYDVFTLQTFNFNNRGYDLLGVIDYAAGGTINLAPGVKEEESWKHIPSTHCDHCHTERLRNKVIIVQKQETGEIFFVGSSCIEEYLGFSVDAHMLLIHINTDFRTLYEEYDTIYSNDHGVSILDIVAGFALSQYRYDREEVRNWVSYISSNRQYMPSDMRAKVREVENRVKDLAGKAIAIIQAKYPYSKINEFSGFERNFLIAFHSRHFRTLNILIGGVCNIVKKLILDEAQGETKNSEHIGKIGQYIFPEVTIKSRNFYMTQWGQGEMIVMSDSNGNIIVWSTSSSPDLTIGKTYKIKAKIKKHSIFRDIKQTMVSHLKVL